MHLNIDSSITNILLKNIFRIPGHDPTSLYWIRVLILLNTAEMTLTAQRLMKMKWYIIAAIVLLSAILGAGAAVDIVAPIGGDMGTYRIHGNVEGAGVFFDGVFKGNISSGRLDVPVYVTGTPYQSYSLEKEGYYPYTGTFTSVPAKNSIIDIYVTMSAIPPVEYGTLHLMVFPVLSSVALDGESMGLVPPTGILIIREVVPGNHGVQVSKEGYATNMTQIYVGKNEIKKVPITLAAAEGVSATGDGATASATTGTAATVSTKAGLSPCTLIGALLGVCLLAGLKQHQR